MKRHMLQCMSEKNGKHALEQKAYISLCGEHPLAGRFTELVIFVEARDVMNCAKF